MFFSNACLLVLFYLGFKLFWCYRLQVKSLHWWLYHMDIFLWWWLDSTIILIHSINMTIHSFSCLIPFVLHMVKLTFQLKNLFMLVINYSILLSVNLWLYHIRIVTKFFEYLTRITQRKTFLLHLFLNQFRHTLCKIVFFLYSLT